MIKMIRNVSRDTSERLDRQRKAMKVSSAAVMLRYFVRQFEVHLKERGKAEMKTAVDERLKENETLSASADGVAAFKMIRGADKDTWERFAAYALLMGRIGQAQMLRYFVLEFDEHLYNDPSNYWKHINPQDLEDLREIVKSYIEEEWE